MSGQKWSCVISRHKWPQIYAWTNLCWFVVRPHFRHLGSWERSSEVGDKGWSREGRDCGEAGLMFAFHWFQSNSLSWALFGVVSGVARWSEGLSETLCSRPGRFSNGIIESYTVLLMGFGLMGCCLVV